MSERSTDNIVRCVGLLFFFFCCAYYAAGQEFAVPSRYRLAIAGKKWGLDLTLLTYELTRANFNLAKGYRPKSSFLSPTESFAENGEALLFAIDGHRKAVDSLYLLIRVMPAPNPLAPSDFRDFVLKKIVKGAHDKKYSDHNQIPVAAYKTPNIMPWIYNEDGSGEPLIPGAKTTSRNLEAYFVKDDVCATLTFKASSFDADEEKFFYSLVDSVKFVDVSNPATSFDFYQMGRVFHARKDFRSAAEAFSAAVKLEQRQSELDLKRWRHLILDAAEVNRALSKWGRVAEVLEYGVNKEPTNTTFLMELARTYAVQGDETKTLRVLAKAFSYMRQQEGPLKTPESGVTVEWSFPDLSKDAAFQQLMKNKSFREAVKALKEANSK